MRRLRWVVAGTVAAVVVATGVGAAGGLTTLYQLMFKQTGTSAVSRTARSKISDFVSVKDFGAVGDGVTNDTVAVTAAITYAGDFVNVYFPCPSTYLTTTWGTIPCGYESLVPATGAVPRPVGTKIQEFLSAKDFGAAGDGVTDDTAEIGNLINAAASTQLVNLPCPGTYVTSTYGTLACGVYYPPVTGTGATPRSVASKLLDTYSVKDFGAKGDGTTDDTSAIQNAIDYVGNLSSFGGGGGVVWMPPGTYYIKGTGTEILLLNKQVILRGAGFLSTVLKVDSSVSGTRDVIHVLATFNQQGGGLEDFRIAPASGTPARYAINVDCTNYALGGYFISRLFVSPLGGDRSVYLTNPTPNISGWYASSIRDSILQSGITLNSLGDNFLISGNLITGAGVGIDVSMINGSANLLVKGNIIENHAGMIHFGNYVETSSIVENEFIGTVADTGSNSAAIDIDGGAGKLANHIEIARNLIQPVQNPLAAVRANYANDVNIHDNSMWRSGAGATHVLTTANATNTRLHWNYYNPTTDGVAFVISDAGTNTWYSTIYAGTGAETASRLTPLVLGTGGVSPPANVGLQAAGGGGSWSSANYGKQLIVDNVTTASNPGIGIFDSGNGNPWMIANNSGALRFQTMPAITDSATAPALRLVMNTNGTSTFSNGLVLGTSTVTYSASMTPSANFGNDFTITATDGVAFTINAPNTPATGQRVTFRIRNTSGGALGAATWDSVYKMAAWANPANGFSRSIDFVYNGSNWIEIGRTPGDVPN